MMKSGIIGVLVLSLVGGILYVSPISNDIQKLLTGTRCLKVTEKAVYEVLEEGRPGKVRVSVVDTAASSTVWSKELTHPVPDNAHSFQAGQCGFYLQQVEGYDFEKKHKLTNYAFGLWEFDYSGNQRRVLVMEGEGTGENNFSSVFNVNSSQKYVTLINHYLGDSNYALVIKNIDKGEDEYVLTLDQVLKQHPNAAGSFDVGTWVTRPDGEYLKTVIYDGSRELAYIYIKSGTWETEIYETPSDLMAGVEGAIPPFAPLLAYTDVIVWAGFAEMTEQLIDEQIASGQKKHLIVANLKTGKKTVVAEVPIKKTHRFKMTWLSDTELQYTMPDGTKKTYRVEE